MAITELRIHPAIGIARIGNSPDGYFVGPERRWDRAGESGNHYLDDNRLIKRQAARFRVFAYHDDGTATELTAANAEIKWTVHLANRKAAAPKFDGQGLRNSSYPDQERQNLIIDPGAQSISGRDQTVALDDGSFTLRGCKPVSVPLGELRTDGDGHLLVLGGLGKSGSPVNRIAQNTSDNDDWYDDLSDGKVTAEVNFAGETHLATGAWVIVAPPRFAPPIDNIIRLWDIMFDKLARSIAKAATPSYTDDIHPILQAARDVGVVNELANGHHDFDHDSVNPSKIFDRVKPRSRKHMPKLNSDNTLSLDLPLTDTQIDMIEKWKDGHFVDDWSGPPSPVQAITPAGLDRSALENCVGGPLFPGIEAGAFLLDPANYADITPPSFRLNPGLRPGDVTAGMSLPWQADFFECDPNWWPVVRPEFVRPSGPISSAQPAAWDGLLAKKAFVDGGWATMPFVVQRADGSFATDP